MSFLLSNGTICERCQNRKEELDRDMGRKSMSSMGIGNERMEDCNEIC
jgi:hypothetical protein